MQPRGWNTEGLLGAFRGRPAGTYYTSTDESKREITRSTPTSRPDLEALHNEWRIQCDRMQRWVEQWREETALAAQDTGDVARKQQQDAIAETVGAVWGAVRNAINEAEQLQFGGGSLSADSDKKGDKAPIGTPRADTRWTAADRAKFAELSEEMQNSINLLYDLLNSRKALRADESTVRRSSAQPQPEPVFTTNNYLESQETLVNPTRSSTTKTNSSLELPPRLDPSSFIFSDDQPPSYNGLPSSSARRIAFLKQPVPPSQARARDSVIYDTIYVPVMIEYASFDEAYRVTGDAPPMDRLHNMLNYYGRCGAAVNYSTSATLPCLGFFEDSEKPRFALVYELPRSAVGDMSYRPTNKEQYEPSSLLKLLQIASSSQGNDNSQHLVPALDERYRLAFNIVQAFSRMHLDETTLHKDVKSDNIIFFRNRANPGDDFGSALYDLRSPYVLSYDLFTEFNLEKAPSSPQDNLYRHPSDPRMPGIQCKDCSDPVCRCPMVQLDLYGLAMVLAEISMWTPASELYLPNSTLSDFRQRVAEQWITRLPSRMGNAYSNVVKDLLAASDRDGGLEDLYNVYERSLTRLRRCLMIDEEEEVSTDSSPAAPFRAPNSVARPALTARSSSQHQYTYDGITGQYTVGFTPRNPLATLTSIAKPFTRLLSGAGSRRPQVPRSVPEHTRDELWQVTPESSFTATEDGGSFTPKSGARNDFGPTEITRESLEQHIAASTIQKAWRRHRSRPSIREYKRNVTLLQRQWRRQMQSRAAWQSTGTIRNSMYMPRDVEAVNVQDYHFQSDAMITISHQEMPVRPRLRVFPNKIHQDVLALWDTTMLPRLEKLISRALRDSDESSSIDLVCLGETALSAKPTIMVTCTSAGKVKKVLERRFEYDHNTFDLKVRKGKIRRSKVARAPKRNAPHRSMVQQEYSHPGNAPLNPFHQQRPLCGASIGAFVGKHLPPVSFGGVVNVDGEVYGMTVHHLLDAPSDDEEDYEDDARLGASRSMAGSSWFGRSDPPSLQSMPTDSMFPLELSDDDFETSSIVSADVSDDGYSSSEDDSVTSLMMDTVGTQGDLDGIIPGSNSKIPVTQPALDDVDVDFFPNVDDRDEDHMDSHKLGYIHASSGIRRWVRDGISHEIDWALIKLNDERLQPYNLVQGGRKYRNDVSSMTFRPALTQPICRGAYSADEDEYPHQIAPSSSLGDLRVHCFGRTSGLKGGVIGSAMSSVRVYQRRSFSRSWAITGEFGVGGDSGAWVIDNRSGSVCGHVLAWCERNAIAYICPMEILLEDMRKTLKAKKICLPGGADLAELKSFEDLPVIDGLAITGAVRSGALKSDDRNDSKFDVANPTTPDMKGKSALDVNVVSTVETPPDTPRSEYSDRSFGTPSPISARRAKEVSIAENAVAQRAAAIAAASQGEGPIMPGLAGTVGSNKKNLGLGIGLIPRTERDTRPIWR